MTRAIMQLFLVVMVQTTNNVRGLAYKLSAGELHLTTHNTSESDVPMLMCQNQSLVGIGHLHQIQCSVNK